MKKVLDSFTDHRGSEHVLIVNEKGNYSIQRGRYIPYKFKQDKEKALETWEKHKSYWK